MLQYSTYPFRGRFPIFKVAGRYKVSRDTCGIYAMDLTSKIGKSYACKDHPEVSIIHKKIRSFCQTVSLNHSKADKIEKPSYL